MTAPVFVGDFAPGSPPWLAARQRGIGGSEIAAILGLSPWESRFSLWHRKMGLAAPVAQNDVMYWGNRLEAVIRDEFNLRHADEYGVAVTGTWRHADRPWQIANPDGSLQAVEAPYRRLYEGKTAYNDDGWGEPGTDEIPVYYRTQCLWYLDVFGLDLCHVAVLISGSDYREYVVEYAPDEVAIMLDAARDFLDTLERRERPNIDEHDATYQVVREMHPDIDDVKFEVPGALIFQGDGTSYVFRRLEDMFEFFRSPGPRINPTYWAEKVVSGQDGIRSFNENVFRAKVIEEFTYAASCGVPIGTGRAVREQLLEGDEVYYESGAHDALRHFEHDGFMFSDTWEWDFRDYDWWFLWACHAIVWGIAYYDKGTRPTMPVAAPAKRRRKVRPDPRIITDSSPRTPRRAGYRPVVDVQLPGGAS